MKLEMGDVVIMEEESINPTVDIFDLESASLENPLHGVRVTRNAWFQRWGVTTRTLQTPDGQYWAGQETVAICLDENKQVIILLPEQIRKA